MLIGCARRPHPVTPAGATSRAEPGAKRAIEERAAGPAAELEGDFPDWNLGDESASPRTMLMFRGNPTHTFYGTGPVPDRPKLLWRTQLGEFQGLSHGKPSVWKGTGWSGHPLRWGKRVYIGSVDRNFYCFNAETGAIMWQFP